MARWFRMYAEMLDNPKVQRLSPELFRLWVNILAVTCRYDGRLPDNGVDIAFALRVPEAEIDDILDELKIFGLLDETDEGFTPHNWHVRQYQSDVSTERVKRFRKRLETVSVTPPETETETETDKKERKKEPRAPRARSSKASIPEGWRPSSEVRLTLQGETELEKMRDWAKSNAILKADWEATWRNWMRRAGGVLVVPPNGNGHADIGFYASFSSPELEAWDEYGRKNSKNYPRDKRGGWTFPTQWPPAEKGLDNAGSFSESRPQAAKRTP